MTPEVMTAELLARFPVERLGWTLLHFLWQGTAIGIVYALLRGIFGRALSAQGRYILAGAALLTLTMAPLLTFAMNPAHGIASQFVRPLPQPDRLLRIAVTLWAAGVVLFSLRLWGGWRLAARLRSAAGPPLAHWQQSMQALAGAMGVTRRVRLLISPLVEAPLVAGWLRPAILVPVEFFTAFPVEQVRALLAHELAHVLRHDYFANILQSIAETVLFFHPAVWWISKQIRAEREHCCDDLAVAVTGDVGAYVRALTELESRQIRPVREAMAASGGSLIQRVRRLLEPSRCQPENLPGPAAACSMTLLWLAGLGAAALHAAPAPLYLTPPAPPSAAIIGEPQQTSSVITKKKPAGLIRGALSQRALIQRVLFYDPLLSAAAPSRSAQLQEVPDAPPLSAEPVNTVLSLPPAPAVTIEGPAQNSGPPTDPHQPAAPLFQTSTRLVLVDVIARGKGSRASGLTQADFTLFDNGKPQQIAFFSPAADLASATSPAPLAAGAVSNRLVEDGAPPSNATVLLIDQRNTPWSDQAFVLQRMVKFLEARRSTGAESKKVGIYTLGPSGSVRVVEELTADHGRLIQAASSIQAQGPLSGASGDPTRLVLETTGVLEAVARHLATVAGRKNLVWISSGWPAFYSRDSGLLPDFSPRMEQTARILTDANLTFYAVDARGLLVDPNGIGAVPDAATRLRAFPILQGAIAPPLDLNPAGADVFTKLADLTGGRTFSDSNGIEDSIQNALDDAAIDYTLGFYPSAAARTPNWHKLKVKLSQRGVGLRYREKYFAAPGGPSPDTRRALTALLKDPLNATQLQLVAHASPDLERPGCSQVSVSIDLHGLHLEKQNNNWVGAVDVSFLVEGSDYARIVASKIKISNDQLAAALERGISLSGSLAVGSGPGELRVVAQDRATGAAGSLTVPLSR